MEETTDITQEELRERVIYALLAPALRFARHFAVPLSEIRDAVEMAYFHETKRSRLKMKEAAAIMQVSVPKVALLSKALKNIFLRPETEAELPRRIELMLWSGPLTLAKIKQVLPMVSNDEINRTVKTLIDEGRIARQGEGPGPAQFALQIDTDRRVWDTWVARVDGLQNALQNVGDAVFARFFAHDTAAFARTLTFHVNRDDLDKLLNE